jgi:hypothetical protein
MWEIVLHLKQLFSENNQKFTFENENLTSTTSIFMYNFRNVGAKSDRKGRYFGRHEQGAARG